MRKLIPLLILIACQLGCATISLPPLPCREIARTQARWARECGHDARIQLFKRKKISRSGEMMGYQYHAACYIEHKGRVYWGSQKAGQYAKFQRLKCPYGTPISEAQFREMVGLQSGVDR